MTLPTTMRRRKSRDSNAKGLLERYGQHIRSRCHCNGHRSIYSVSLEIDRLLKDDKRQSENSVLTSSPSLRILGAETNAKLSVRSWAGFPTAQRIRVSPERTDLT